MGTWHVRHFPPSQIQLSTGTLSRHASGVPHDGQRDGGVTIDSPAGSLPMQTFRKLPTINPRIPMTRSSPPVIVPSLVRVREDDARRVHGPTSLPTSRVR